MKVIPYPKTCVECGKTIKEGEDFTGSYMSKDVVCTKCSLKFLSLFDK